MNTIKIHVLIKLNKKNHHMKS